MALDKQKIPISFARGIDTKTDDKQTLSTNLLELENGVFTKTGALNKRFGYDILNQNIEGSVNTITSGRGLTKFKNELNLFDGTSLYSFLDANEKWIERGSLVSVLTENKSIIKNPFQQTIPDFTSDGNTSVYVWEDSRGGVRYSVLDESSSSFIVTDVEVSSTGEQPKVYVLKNNFIITYIKGTTISFRTVPIGDPTTINTEAAVVTNLDPTDKVYDAQNIGDRVFFVWNNSDIGGGVSLRFLFGNLTPSNEVSIVGEAKVCATVVGDSDLNAWAFFYDGTDLKAWIYNQDLTTEVLTVTTVETVADVRNVTAIESVTDTMTVLYEITNTSGSLPANFIRKNTISDTGTVGTAGVFERSIGLASKLFTTNSQFYFVAVHESDLQSTYFVYSITGDIISKINTQVAGGYTDKSVLPNVVEFQTGKFQLAVLKKIKLVSENDDVFSRLGVQAITFDFTSLNNFITSELANNLHIVGGMLQMYDGTNVVEHGFNVFPEGETTTEVNLGAGAIADGTYQYSSVYGWTDNQGQIHRSAPSIPVTIVVSSGPSDVDIEIPTLRTTKKENAFIELYRTENLGTLFFKVTTEAAPLLNDKTVDTVTFNDTTTDASLISNEILYTTGGVLDNIAPPASSISATFKSRIFIDDLDDSNVIRFSKIRKEGFPVEFNDTLVRSVDSKGGKITTLSPLDDKLIIFKSNAIFFLAGEGPNNLGLQDDYLEPQLITSDVGCIEPNSVVDTPLGLMFKSSKGIYMLTRGLQTTYIGAAVEKFNDNEISSAALVANTNQVRFTTEENLALVYDYFFGQWSTFTNHEAQGAAIYEDKYTFIKDDGQVYQENFNKFTDGSEFIKLRLVSSWIQISGIQGFQRAYKVALLGDFKSEHKLNVKVGYDFNPTFIQEVTIDATTLLGITAYGDGSPYGTGDPIYGGEFPLYQWNIHFKRQKCQAIRINIEDIQGENFGEGFSISNMNFQVGTKVGTNKLEDSSTFGTE